MLAFLLVTAATSLPPKPDHHLTDRARVFNEAQAKALDEKLTQFERDTSNQILVYIDQFLPAETTVDQVASEAFREWSVKKNGVILFVFLRDRKMRIEVGPDLKSKLNDATAKRIVLTVLRPDFEKGDYAGGIEKGVDALMIAMGGARRPAVRQLRSVVSLVLALALIAVIFMLMLRRTTAARRR